MPRCLMPAKVRLTSNTGDKDHEDFDFDVEIGEESEVKIDSSEASLGLFSMFGP